jgi:hypothetical protein
MQKRAEPAEPDLASARFRAPMSPRPRLVGPAAASALFMGALAGCARGAPAVRPEAVEPAPARAAAACLLAPGEAPARDTVALALLDPVDPAHAPTPVNRSERLVFAQLYEPLLRVDCTGTLQPALATDWTTDDGGRTWVLRLRDDAQWNDGAPLTATDVAASLRERGVVASALGDRAVAVTLEPAMPSGPRALADLPLGIVRPRPGGWPAGTGPYHLDSAAAVAVGASPALRLVRRPGADPRDLLDGGADLVVTDDPVALAYARERDEFVAAPLPWDRAYALVAPAGGSAAAPLSADERAGLAHDAVRVEARAASSACEPVAHAASGAAGTGPRAPGRVVYSRGDPVARDLAARLVALGRAGPGGTAVAVDPGGFAAALRAGRDAVVMALSPRALADCRMAAPPGSALLPLIEVRPTALLRRGVPPPRLDADGTLRWAPGGAAR